MIYTVHANSQLSHYLPFYFLAALSYGRATSKITAISDSFFQEVHLWQSLIYFKKFRRVQAGVDFALEPMEQEQKSK